MLRVSELYIYPIKSLSGIALQKAQITDKGFAYDRRWMLVDMNNCFLTQREHAQMALLSQSIEKDVLRITHKTNKSSITVPLNPLPTTDRQTVTIWDDTCIAEFVSEEADGWFSEMLGLKCRLVYMPDDCRRIVDQRYAPENSVTSFADAYPFLLIGRSSLDELNSRLAESLPMNRFRPNIVFTGGQPFGEDQYDHFTISGIDFHGVKLCARCVLTTIDQETAMKGKEPLKTLASYRFKNNKILFGQNLVHSGTGEITVGDELMVLQEHVEDRFIV
ncbi:MOSC domain-containing protein [Mucilaginibacter sp. BJC16-A38]|uniref:MOSC domain-containing protein n=1 Tax=Mucilaginibacter phenanthrenivorans TaxID=1234842 RepID=UPI0021577144|nr:MOSC N-terminal beta barrel domain-containing protein [Mucilaginibacter phenanthrenivorans]MCR8560538.1 MOSC domain-containing protein [Mucilaginibacter phenanthrenivorans]